MEIQGAKSSLAHVEEGEERIQSLVRDARVVDKGERVRAGAYTRRYSEEKAAQRSLQGERGGLAVVGKAAEKGVVLGLEHAAEHVASHGARTLGGLLGAGAVAGGAAFGLVHMFEEYIVRPNEDGAALRNATRSDALNAAVVHVLPLRAEFKNVHAAGRLEVEQSTGRLVSELMGKHHGTRAMLVARCDDGMRAAFDAVRRLGAAAAREVGSLDAQVFEALKKSGEGAALERDIGFGIGVRYVTWMTTHLTTAELAKERAALDARDVRATLARSPVG